MQGIFDFQIRESDYVTNIYVRKIDDISNCRHALK
jgi:hypothetical protein